MTPAILAAASIFTCAAPGIVDGDTIRCQGQRVRLWGINAPERSDPRGPAATRALADIIRGRTLTCEPKDTDRYGRIVARCFVGRRDIAAEMVRQGHAVDMPRYSKGFYAR
jgi:Micrococcal nuclease (thermonuclease) homologs